MRCEYLTDPLGIDVVQPRLSWKLESQWRGQKQTAYQVLVASEEKLLAGGQGRPVGLGQGRVRPVDSRRLRGQGAVSRTRCYWKVRAWDKDDKPTPFSSVAVWEMGLLTPQDWQGKWIDAAPGKERARCDEVAAAGAAVSQGVHAAEAAAECRRLHLRPGLL